MHINDVFPKQTYQPQSILMRAVLEPLIAKSVQRHESGKMNKTEEAYAAELQCLVLAKQVRSWRFESVKLRLADRTWLTPDFEVIMADGTIEFHEVKAMTKMGKTLIRDDAAVKIKVAAEEYKEFAFKLCAKGKSGWSIKVVGKLG